MTHARSKRRLHDRRGRRPALTLLGFLALTTAWGPPAWGQGTSHSSWNCVPEQAVFAIRIPDGSDCIDALREQTKLGAVFFNDKLVAGQVFQLPDTLPTAKATLSFPLKLTKEATVAVELRK